MQQQNNILGTVKGPGEKPNEYIFISTDNQRTKIGEFVYYTYDNDKKIIGNISDKRIVRCLPDSFFANPEISPHEISEIIGIEEQSFELFEVTVTINGYFEKSMEAFINPRVAPNPGDSVCRVSSKDLAEIINSKINQDNGSAMVGTLLTRDKEDVPVILNVKNLVSTHLAILASTGSGKSYTAGVLIEELMKPYNRAAVLIVDPHNEYDTLKEIESHPAFESMGYKPKVELFSPDKVKVRVSSLTEHDIKYLLPNLSEKMSYYLSQAYRKVSKGADPSEDTSYLWDVHDLCDELEAIKESEPEAESTISALNWRLQSRIAHSQVFSSNQHIPLNKLFKPGQCTVLQLSEIDQTEQQVILSTLLRRINRARMDTHKGYITDTTKESYIPYPVFCLLEEAHRYAPANAPSVSLNILKQILSEGRKFGVGIGLITQRPGKLDSDILSQCMTQIIMKIINPIDQNSIAASVEAAGAQLLKELPSLTKGQVIISGVSLNTSVLCKIRQRITNHGGTTIDAPAEWHEYFNPQMERSREMDKTFLKKRDTGVKLDGLSI